MLLRPKAHLLLAHLAQHLDRVVPKAELMDAVWRNVHVSEDSLTQCVRELRKALGDTDAQLLRTVPGRGYLLHAGNTASASTQPSAQPSVAVLRLRNEGAEADTAFVDGFGEDIINGLARFRTVSVLARHSTFAAAAGDFPDWQAVGRQLNAQYLVDGRLRRDTDGVAVTVGLIDAASARQMWRDQFAAKGTDIFALQDEIAHQIVNRVVARIEDAGRSAAARKPPASLAAYDLFLQGVARLRGYTMDDNLAARMHFAAALEKDPAYAPALAYAALAEIIIHGYASAPADILHKAEDDAARAVTLDPEEPRCHRILALIQIYLRKFDGAEHAQKRSLELNPYDADMMAQTGFLRTIRGRPMDGLAWIERAMRINPMHPPWYHFDRATALYSLGEYREAAACLGRLPTLTPWTLAKLAACCAKAGDLETARGCIDRMRRTEPNFDPLHYALVGISYEHDADVAHLREGIALAMTVAS
ncbi:winged helix-turn-helix domain-containing tetratricopeptide repeat protein [Dongia sp.]|uniref:winged helix-turn-helix domain-containing tetratricopeptide repeat protein n=1 Tax=Dongia sp. TaxID=1977262 RepID=UPI0035AF0A8B